MGHLLKQDVHKTIACFFLCVFVSVDASRAQIATEREQPPGGLPPYTGVGAATVLGRFEFGVRGEAEPIPETKASDRDVEIAYVFNIRSGQLVPWEGQIRGFYLSRIETNADLRSNVVATGAGVQLSAIEGTSQVKWVTRMTMLSRNDQEPRANDWQLSAYFGAEIALSNERSTALRRLKDLPVVIERKIDLRALNFRNDADRLQFKKNLGLHLMSTYFIEILGLDGHFGEIYTHQTENGSAQIKTASLLKTLGQDATYDADQLGNFKYCAAKVREIVGDYLLTSMRRRHPLSLVATLDDRLLGRDILPQRGHKTNTDSMIDDDQMFDDFIFELTQLACKN